MKELTITITLEEYDHLLQSRSQAQKESEAYQKSVGEALAENLNLTQELAALRWENLSLKRRLWGKSSEKHALPQDPAQLCICFNSPVDVIDPLAEEAKAVEKAVKVEKQYNRFRKSFTKKVTPHARKPIPEHLRREDRIVPMPAETNLEGAVCIGEEVTEQYAFQPAEVYVIRTVRPKYRLANGQIVIAPMPVMAHPRSNASESILAHMAIAKYADHLPLNRQLEIFERENIHLSPSTVSNWMMAAAQRIEPIYNELRELVKESYYVLADETPHSVLETDRPGALHQGYMWNFYLPEHKTPFFEYHQGRGAQGINTLLSGGVKAIHSDGFSVYGKFDTLPGRIHLCCWAHARREFVEAKGCDPPRAEYAIKEIALLYQLEKEIIEKGLSGEQIVELRREKAYPVIRRLEAWCRQEYVKTIAKSPIAKAMAYMYKRFEQLSAYVNDARFLIDNNPVERSMRPLTLNRKNVLFSGSHEAAHAAAIFFSLIGCCKENKVNPEEWLRMALIKVQEQEYLTKNSFRELLPFNWKEKGE